MVVVPELYHIWVGRVDSCDQIHLVLNVIEPAPQCPESQCQIAVFAYGREVVNDFYRIAAIFLGIFLRAL